MRTNSLFVITFLLLLSGCGPRIDHFSPTIGPPGTEVEITGSRLTGDDGASVALAGIAQPDVISANPNQILFRVSPDAITGQIEVNSSRGVVTSEAYFDVVSDADGSNGAYTFGGIDNVQALKVESSENGQPVLIAVTRALWAPVSGNFAAFEPDIDAAFATMNDFWLEASFGRTSFEASYVVEDIFNLPKSNDYYYHRFQQRNIQGAGVPATITLPDDQTLFIKSDGQDIEVEFAAGDWTKADIAGEVAATIVDAPADEAAPTFTFSDVGPRFIVETTITGEDKAKLSLSGGAVPFFGFGAEQLYDNEDDGPFVTIFGAPLDKDAITFADPVLLTIETLGVATDVGFPAGEMSLSEVVDVINIAMQDFDLQQPFDVTALDDPADSSNGFLVFSTDVADNDDHGTRLQISGTARQPLGLQDEGVVRRYEKETFRGAHLISDALNAHAETLPAGVDLDDIFGDARMFVGMIVDNNTFRAHHNSHSFDIQGHDYETNYFAARMITDLGEVFAHETGHALGLPDLYRDEPWQVGNPPGNWDVMDCSFCDAHPVAWLKSRHHRNPDNRGDPWVDDPRLLILGPPQPLNNLSETIILTPVDSPWISANPFATSHPGIPVVHGVELIPTDPKDVFFVENRQRGPYTADHLGDPIDFSTQTPGEGVIMYQGRRGLGSIASFLPVNMLSPVFDPLNLVGESREHVITNMNKIVVTVQDKLLHPDGTAGNPSFSYLTQIDWGQGSFFDLAIREWDPPPWESIDIWVDNAVQNDWGVYTYHDENDEPILNGDNVAVGETNHLIARVHNLGDVDITDDVIVIWRVHVPQLAGGNVDGTELGRVTIPGGIQANTSVETPPLTWRPNSDDEGHVCIRAEIITVSGELNATLNNLAQENITQWFSRDGSPFETVEFDVVTKNPFADREIQVRLFVPGVPQGWTVEVQEVEFSLSPNGALRQQIRVKPYLEVLMSLSPNKRYIEEFAANIEARTPIGDEWVAFGGTTAIVHPVNNISRIRLDRKSILTQDGLVAIGAELETEGAQSPPLGGRQVHIKLWKDEATFVWIHGDTNNAGRFQGEVPSEWHGTRVTGQAFYGGGRGIAPTRSSPATLDIPSP